CMAGLVTAVDVGACAGFTVLVSGLAIAEDCDIANRLTIRIPALMKCLDLVSVGLLESFEADEGGGQREEGCEGVGAAFVAQRQAAVAGEPGHGAFDDPPVAAEALLGLDILACQPRPDFPVS